MNGTNIDEKDEHLSYLLTAYAFESISEAGRLEVERHLASCPECREELDEIRRTVSSVRGAYPEVERGGSATFEARKLERILAAARSRRRGRITWLGWPMGAAAGLLLFAVFLAFTGRSSSVVTPYVHESAGDEDFAARVAASPGPTTPPPEAPAAEPAPTPAATADDTLAMRVAGAQAAGNRTAEMLRDIQDSPSPAKPAEVAQAEDSPRRRSAKSSLERMRSSKMPGGPGGGGGHVDSFGGIVLDGVTGGQDKGFGEEASAGKKLASESETAGLSVRTDRGVHAWSYDAGAAEGLPVEEREGAEIGKLTELDAALGRGKVPIKNLAQIQDGERKEAGASGQKTDERFFRGDANTSEFTAPSLGLDELRESANRQLFTTPADSDAYMEYFAKELKDNVPVTLGTTEQVQGVVAAFDWGLGYRQNETKLRPSLAARSSRERLLRAWSHWKALDAGLALDAFEARRLDIPPPSPEGEGLPAEEFRKRYGVHPFVETRIDAQSTFGMDVDTASYTIARGALASGALPRPDQVRVEEFVNYFPEPSTAASKDGVFAVACEGGPSLFGKGLDLLKITIRARDIAPGERKDAVLTLAVDTSGSMHHGGRLTLVRDALRELVAALEPGDRVAVVGFGDHPYLVLPHTSAREAERILDALESLAPRGDTNFEAGLDLAYRVADEALEPRAVNRIILCSDGVATSGARGPEELLAKIEAYARRGIHLSTLGVGLGKYNDRLLEMLADRGNGSYAYADDRAAAADVFRKNLPGSLQVLARDAKIQVVFDPAVVTRYRLLGYENRDIADKDFRNDQVDAGEVGPGTTVTVLYEIERASGSSGDLGRIHLRYLDTGTERVEEEDYPLPPGVIATSIDASSGRFRFMACVAEMAELLRDSYWARDGSFGDVLAALLALGPEDQAKPEVREVLGLAARAQSLVLAKLEGK